MTSFVRRKRPFRSYWVEIGFLLLGIVGLKPSIITDMFTTVRPDPNYGYANSNPYSNDSYRGVVNSGLNGGLNLDTLNRSVDWAGAYAALVNSLHANQNLTQRPGMVPFNTQASFATGLPSSSNAYASSAYYPAYSNPTYPSQAFPNATYANPAYGANPAYASNPSYGANAAWQSPTYPPNNSSNLALASTPTGNSNWHMYSSTSAYNPSNYNSANYNSAASPIAYSLAANPWASNQQPAYPTQPYSATNFPTQPTSNPNWNNGTNNVSSNYWGNNSNGYGRQNTGTGLTSYGSSPYPNSSNYPNSGTSLHR